MKSNKKRPIPWLTANPHPSNASNQSGVQPRLGRNPNNSEGESMAEQIGDDLNQADNTQYKDTLRIPASNKRTKKGPSTRKRSRKDPSAPKHPSSAFFAYSNPRRAALKKKNPTATTADLNKMLAKSWEALDPMERAVFVNAHARAMEKYKAEMAEWKSKKIRFDALG